MHYVAIFTGAREQTVLTLRCGSFLKAASEHGEWPFKLPCGPGTGVDTKRNVRGFLVVPRELYEKLHVYAVSEQAVRRRFKSRLGEDPTNYLFLTNRGKPYYNAIDELRIDFDQSSPGPRFPRTGQNLREFIAKHVIPAMRKKRPDFKYKFHDLRATFGMNWVDSNSGGNKQNFMWLRDQLRKLMWHRQAATTDLYLNYREHHDQLEAAQSGWSSHLLGLVEAA
jgi:hypothetical protein